MRLVLPAAVLALLVLVAGAAATPAQPPTDQEHLALLVVQKNMEAAIETEKDAFYALKKDNDAAARKYLAESAHIMEETGSAARLLTLPPDLADVIEPGAVWRGLGDLVERIQLQDENVFKTKALEKYRLGMIQWALQKKEQIRDAVTAQLKDTNCAELVNLQGPIVVNGVPQGQPQLTVEVSCKEPEKSIYVDIPLDIITGIDPDNGDTAKILPGGKVGEIDLHGAKTGGAVIETNPAPAAGTPITDEVVPIAGDSTVEIVQEVM